jgi:hypothetical protein
MVAVARPPLSARRAALLTRVATWALVFAALRVVGEIFDLSWHLSREQQAAFLGLPHPWNLPHFIVAAGVLGIYPLYAMTRPALLDWIRSGFRGNALAALTASPGSTLIVLGFPLFLLTSGVDTAGHIAGIKEGTYSPAHLAFQVSNIFAPLGMLLLVRSELAARERRTWLEWAWLCAVLAAFMMPFPPGGILEFSGSTRVVIAMFKVALPVVLIVHLGPRRFPLTSIFVPYVIARWLVGGGLSLIGYSHPAPPLWEFAVAAVAGDLVLLAFGRSRVGRMAAVLLFGLVWGAVSYRDLLRPDEVWTLRGQVGAIVKGGAIAGAAALLILVPMALRSPRVWRPRRADDEPVGGAQARA